MWINDLISVLEDAGVGTLGSNIFATTKAALPNGNGPYLSVRPTGGTGPDETHNAVTTPAYQRPGAQLIATASTYSAAESKAVAAYNALYPIRNQLIGSGNTWYRRIKPQQEPFDLGTDSMGRAQVAFNVLADKRPNS